MVWHVGGYDITFFVVYTKTCHSVSPLNSGDRVSSLDSDGESSVSWETSWPCPSFSSGDKVLRREDGGEQSAAVLPGREDMSEMLSSGLGSGLRGHGSGSLEDSRDKRAEARRPGGQGEKTEGRSEHEKT